MNTREIVLFVFDEKKNFNNPQTQIQIGIKLYKKVILIENENEFKKHFDALPNQQKFVLMVHVFHAPGNSSSGVALSGYMNFETSQIEKDYGIEGYMVSSGSPDDVHNDIYKKTHHSRAIYMYSQFNDNLAAGKLNTYTKTSLAKGKKTDKSGKGQYPKSRNGIFLSHSSKDADIVNKFREIILESGLSVPPDQIKFTSAEDNGVHSGISIPEDLRKFLKYETGLFIQFISSDYIKSRVCLNEEGAAWCMLPDRMFLSIIIPPATFTDMSWVKDHNKALKITETESLMNIYEHRKTFFKKVNFTRLSSKITSFIQIAEALINP